MCNQQSEKCNQQSEMCNQQCTKRVQFVEFCIILMDCFNLLWSGLKKLLYYSLGGYENERKLRNQVITLLGIYDMSKLSDNCIVESMVTCVSCNCCPRHMILHPTEEERNDEIYQLCKKDCKCNCRHTLRELQTLLQSR